MKEALFGYNKKIKHLDWREFFIESKKVTQPNEVRVITREGMPFFAKLEHIINYIVCIR